MFIIDILCAFLFVIGQKKAGFFFDQSQTVFLIVRPKINDRSNKMFLIDSSNELQRQVARFSTIWLEHSCWLLPRQVPSLFFLFVTSGTTFSSGTTGRLFYAHFVLRNSYVVLKPLFAVCIIIVVTISIDPLDYNWINCARLGFPGSSLTKNCFD